MASIEASNFSHANFLPNAKPKKRHQLNRQLKPVDRQNRDLLLSKHIGSNSGVCNLNHACLLFAQTPISISVHLEFLLCKNQTFTAWFSFFAFNSNISDCIWCGFLWLANVKNIYLRGCIKTMIYQIPPSNILLMRARIFCVYVFFFWVLRKND